MQLIILRHGKAENDSTDGDFARALIEEGRCQARIAAQLLMSAGDLPEIVLTSPLLRARQTAEEFCAAATISPPLVQNWLACGMSPEEALTQLDAFKDFNRVAIVGHEPDLSVLIQSMLGIHDGGVKMTKGCVACVEWISSTRYGVLRYLIPSKFNGLSA
jgi:phosphohistidine phosphatase